MFFKQTNLPPTLIYFYFFGFVKHWAAVTEHGSMPYIYSPVSVFPFSVNLLNSPWVSTFLGSIQRRLPSLDIVHTLLDAI